MPRTLSFTDEALADLAAIQRWQTQTGSGAAARRRLLAIRAAIRRLRRMPCLYPVRDQPGTREMPCEGHRVFYEVDPDTGRNDSAGDIRILRVFGPGQSRPGP